MPLGIEIGLGPGDFVLDGDPAASPEQRAPAKGHSSHPSFRSMSIVATVAQLSYCRALVVVFVLFQTALRVELKSVRVLQSRTQDIVLWGINLTKSSPIIACDINKGVVMQV